VKPEFETPRIVPREKLDFGFDGNIPKYWFDGDPFKSRLIDAMSVVFPEGEKFFIASVRNFREQVTNPRLKEDVKNFIRQESQHTMVHTLYNERLKRQGASIDRMVDRIAQKQQAFFEARRRTYSQAFNLALTAASEHITSSMTHAFFDRRSILEYADPRMRALYAWHSIEEIEHKAVAFDVMRDVAKVGYFRRCAAMLMVLWTFNATTLVIARAMLKFDGFSEKECKRIFRRGLLWLYGPAGLFSSSAGHLLSYFKPGYHPWQEHELSNYQAWLDAFNSTGDPVLAGNALFMAGA
jgi:predicted metal-dependent hydrolase